MFAVWRRRWRRRRRRRLSMNCKVALAHVVELYDSLESCKYTNKDYWTFVIQMQTKTWLMYILHKKTYTYQVMLAKLLGRGNEWGILKWFEIGAFLFYCRNPNNLNKCSNICLFSNILGCLYSRIRTHIRGLYYYDTLSYCIYFVWICVCVGVG